MTKGIKKLVAAAAAAMMAVSMMAVNSAAITHSTSTGNQATAYGTAVGSLSIDDATYRLVTAHTAVSSVAPEVDSILYIFDYYTGQQLYYTDVSNPNAMYATAFATSASFAPITARSTHIVGTGASAWVRSLTLSA